MKRFVMTGVLTVLTAVAVANPAATTPNPSTQPASTIATDTATSVPTLTGPTQNLSPNVLKLAMSAYDCAQLSGVAKSKTLTVIDYSLPSTTPRMWVIDVQQNKVLFNSLVAHGQGSGDQVKTTRFSNQNSSHATSLGLFVTGAVYQGKNGYSLKLYGLDKGFNDNAAARAVVVHGAPYVSESIADSGRLGRSWGCPAVPQKLAKPIIDTIKDGNLVFSYYPDSKWLSQSKYVNCPTSVLAQRQPSTQQG